MPHMFQYPLCVFTLITATGQPCTIVIARMMSHNDVASPWILLPSPCLGGEDLENHSVGRQV